MESTSSSTKQQGPCWTSRLLLIPAFFSLIQGFCSAVLNYPISSRLVLWTLYVVQIIVSAIEETVKGRLTQPYALLLTIVSGLAKWWPNNLLPSDLTQRVRSLLVRLFDSSNETVTSSQSVDIHNQSLISMEELAEQLEQLSENVANLQAASEGFKNHRDQLLDEIGDIKNYLELLYHQLKQEELLDDYVFRPDPGDLNNNQVAKLDETRNPDAHLETSMDEFGQSNQMIMSLSQLYAQGRLEEKNRRGVGLVDDPVGCWLRPPKSGDYILLQFRQPVLLKKFKIGTGHYLHPANKLSNATVEILPVSITALVSAPCHPYRPILIRRRKLHAPKDHYLVVGRFDHAGLAHGEVDWRSIGPVRSLRIQLHSGCLNWVLVTELSIEAAPTTNNNNHLMPVDTLPVIVEEDCEYW